FSNIVFYRSFTDFITIPQLFQVNNASDLSSSIFSLIKIYDIFIFLDVYIICRLCRKHRHRDKHIIYNKRQKSLLLIIFLLLLIIKFLLIEIETYKLISRVLDREYIVKNLDVFYFHIYDAALQYNMRTQKIVADKTNLDDIKQYIEEVV